MKVLLTSSTNVFGQHLVKALLDRGHQVSVIAAASGLPGTAELSHADVVIHLGPDVPALRRGAATAGINPRDENVRLNERVAQAIRASNGKVKRLVATSSAAIYGATAHPSDERADSGSDRLARYCAHLESSLNPGVEVTTIRLGNILSSSSQWAGLLPLLASVEAMRRPHKLDEWVSWIHVDDAIALVVSAVEGKLSGIVNGTSPGLIQLKALADAVSACSPRRRKAAGFRQLVKLLSDENSSELFAGPRAAPTAALAAGFTFAHDSIHTALWDIFGVQRARRAASASASRDEPKQNGNRVYYFQHGEGSWRGRFNFKITDWKKFGQANLGLQNRLLCISSHVMNRVLGTLKIESRLVGHPDRGENGVVANEIAMLVAGRPVYRQSIEYILHPNGRDVSVVGWERHGAFGGLISNPVDNTGRIEPDGRHSEYRLNMLGDDWVGKYELDPEGRRLVSKIVCAWGEAGEDLEKQQSGSA